MSGMIEMTRKGFIGSSVALAATGLLGAEDSPRLAATKKWFKEAQFGMMAHWGLYTLPGGEWNGKPGRRAYAEWLQWGERIPMKEYAALAKAFNPVLFDPKDWMKRARDAGMKYFVITSKHHDGFAMFRSKASKYNVVDATPFGRDPLEEIAEACRDTGIRLGLYYSQDLDWSHPDGGGYTRPDDWCGSSAWTNNWDFPDKARKDLARYFEEKAKPQVEAILTQYGDLALIWFDIGSTLTEDQAFALYSLVRRHQPGCLVNSRIGGGSRQGTNKRMVCDYTSSGDNEIPTDDKGAMLYESCATLNDSWGYKPADQNWKGAEKVRMKASSVPGEIEALEKTYAPVDLYYPNPDQRTLDEVRAELGQKLFDEIVAAAKAAAGSSTP